MIQRRFTELNRKGNGKKHTFDLPKLLCDGPALQHAAKDELAGTLHFLVDGRIHVSQTHVENVRARREANHKLRREGVLDLVVVGRVVRLVCHNFLQQVLCEERHGGDALFPVKEGRRR